MIRFFIGLFGLLAFTGQLTAVNLSTILKPVKTDSPRDTMRTFYRAMNDYRLGLESEDEILKLRIHDAVRTLDLSNHTQIMQDEVGRKAAILLKEVIDRIVVIDYDKIPDQADKRWRLKNTDITIVKIESGARAGEFLFSQDTVARVREYYKAVAKLPYLTGSGKGAGYKVPWFERRFPKWLKQELFGLYHWQWIGIFLAIFFGLAVRRLAHFGLDLLKKVVSRSKAIWDDKIIEALDKPFGWVGAAIFWIFALSLLQLDGTTALGFLSTIVQIILSGSLLWAAYRLSDLFTYYLNSLASQTNSPFDDQLVPLLSRAMRTFVVIFGTLVAIQNLGINVMSLLAGLGLGGLAFALAAKDTAANLFGSIMILWDKPFKVGDWIKTGGVEGTVEEIGFRSTRIRTFYTSQVSVPNSELASGNIDNMGRRPYRRIYATLGVTYDTPPEKLEAFMEGIRNIIKNHPSTRKDYYHVVLAGFGASSLDIMVYFFLTVPDWTYELVARQNVFLDVLRLAHRLEVKFAFPTQSLHVESLPDKPLAPHEAISNEELASIAREFGPKGGNAKPQGLGIYTPLYSDS